MQYDIVAIGSATVDQFADTDSELIRIDTPTTHEKLIAFPLGSKILIRELDLSTGGGGTNSAVALARLGLHTACLGKIGTDGNGDFVIQKLKEENIDFIGPRQGNTGLSVILNSFAHDRTILAYKGANNELLLNEIKPFETRWVYLSSMLGTSFETVTDLICRHEFRVAFNPSNYQAEMGYQKLSRLIDRVEILVMNREEACKFLGRSFRESPEPQELLMAMAELPPRIFVITDGGNGVYVYDRERFYIGHPTPDLEVRETTGAGDAFASTFTAACVLGETVERAIHLAMTNAESVLKFRGAKERLLTRDALMAEAATLDRRIDQQMLA